jgi:hypothetical protein
MRDAQYPLRLAIFGVLNGILTYNGQPVKLYDEKKKVGQNDNVYVLMGTQLSTPIDDNDSCWITDETIDLEFLHRTEFEVTKDFIDGMTNQACGLLMPDKLTAALPNPTLMQIQYFDLRRAVTRSVEISPTETIIAKIITFGCKVIQQNG